MKDILYCEIIIFFYFIYSIIKVVSINFYSEVVLTIKGKRQSQILNNAAYDYCDRNDFAVNAPDKIYINGILKEKNNSYIYNLEDETNIVTIIWEYKIKDCFAMFANLKNIEKIDFSNFDTSEVTYMGCMFEKSLFKSLDLGSFNTSMVTNMRAMFFECTSLVSLNLNNFNILNVESMRRMFYGCSSLVSLNLNKFDTSNLNNSYEMFKGINSSLNFCINETKNSIILSSLSSLNIGKLDCNKICNGNEYYICLEDKCPEEYKFLIPQKRKCIKNCIFDDVYKYEYNNKCDKIENLINYLNTTSKMNDSQIEENILRCKELILNMNSENIISEIKDGQDIIIKMYKTIISLTSTENQNINKNKNITRIDLGECENILKGEYNIPNNESLLIYKVDILKETMKIPRIEYEIYYPLNGSKLEKLDLNKCPNMKIDINVPIIINEKDIDKHNISSNYYNDICYRTTSEHGADITLNDRKNIYIDNDMNACEENCKFEKYDKELNKSLCSCDIKTNFNLFSEVRKNSTLLLIGFKDLKSKINLKILKCYHIIFNNNGLAKNIGSFITFSVMLFQIIGIIIFYKKE